MGLLWLLLRLPYHRLGRRQVRGATQVGGLVISLRSIAICLALVGGATGLITLRGYQGSFYAQSAPLYDQITQATPFLCGKTAPTGTTVEGAAVFNRLLTAVASNPAKVPGVWNVALGTGEERRAQAFRESLLQEAAAQRFSQAASSVKYIQYEAAQRATMCRASGRPFPDCSPRQSCVR